MFNLETAKIMDETLQGPQLYCKNCRVKSVLPICYLCTAEGHYENKENYFCRGCGGATSCKQMFPACQNSVTKEMFLDYNNLFKIPDFGIGSLAIERLTLNGNHINEVPTGIGKLENCWCLELDSNELKKIAPEIGNLVSLEELDLDHNQLTELPNEIGQLVNLEFMSIEYNQLTDLPEEIGNLINLKDFLIYGNDFSKDIIRKIEKLLPNATIHNDPV